MTLLHRLALALALLFLWIAPASAADRTIVPLAAEWRFIRADVSGAETPSFDDKEWLTVTLPHTFNGGDGETAGYHRGPAWYRRGFQVKALAPNRRVFVQFDGAATRADVYVNGRFIGRHDGGHATFRFDVTSALVTGRNLLAVRVDNSPNKAITPLGGDFTIFGGLYRPVSLIEVDPLHFDLLDYGGPGIYARSVGTAGVSIDARVTNDLSKARRASVLVRLLDADGREVARSTRGIRVPGRSVRVANLQLNVPNPRLWNGVRDPYLYRVVASIGGGDEVTVPFGFRTFRFDATQGFILNGKPYPLHGANLMHSARPGKGTAVTDAEIAEDFAILREMGSTGVRLVHFQHPRAAYDEADRLGLVAWTEIGVNSEVADTREFRANAEQQLRELIAQNYNHPSVVMWGLGNEVYSTEAYVARILGELNAVAHAADPTRPTTYAHCCQGDDDPKALASDIIGFNRYFGWYPDAKGTIGEWADQVHKLLPNRPIAVSEYGAGASILHQEDPPVPPVAASGWHPEQYQALYHEKNWVELRDKPYLWGKFIWVAFDLASAGRKEGDRPGINDKGIVTYDRQVRKDAFYWYQANWSDVPMLHLTSKRFVTRFDRRAEVKAYTNAGAATLVLNGREVGRAEPADHILRWNVELQEGENRIEIRSADGKLSDSAVWTYQEAPVTLVAPR